jgi:hypothetical protein
MDQEPKEKQERQPQEGKSGQRQPDELEISRRDFFISLGKWSKIVIAAALLGLSVLREEAGSVMMGAQPSTPWSNTGMRNWNNGPRGRGAYVDTWCPKEVSSRFPGSPQPRWSHMAPPGYVPWNNAGNVPVLRGFPPRPAPGGGPGIMWHDNRDNRCPTDWDHTH